MTVRYQADADPNQVIVTGVIAVFTMVKTGTFLWGRGAPPQKCPNQIGYRYIRREPVIDFQTAFAAGLEGVKDPEVLALAAQQGRILVSHQVFDV